MYVCMYMYVCMRVCILLPGNDTENQNSVDGSTAVVVSNASSVQTRQDTVRDSGRALH